MRYPLHVCMYDEVPSACMHVSASFWGRGTRQVGAACGDVLDRIGAALLVLACGAVCGAIAPLVFTAAAVREESVSQYSTASVVRLGTGPTCCMTKSYLLGWASK